MSFYISNNIKWIHTPETVGEWEEWKLLVNNQLLVVRRIDPLTSLAPKSFEPSEWKAEYQVKYCWELIASMPLDTPIDEVLIRAIAETRLR